MGKNLNIVTKYWQNLNWFSLSLFPLGLVYCLLIKIRKYCYYLQLCKSSSFSVPVIIIGNITVGGNGKTPLIMHLVNKFKRRGYRPGVVSRGYGAVNPQLDKGKILSVNLSNDAKNYGDEPWMIAKKTSCPVVVGHKRANAVEFLIKEFDCNIVLSDDGMQHYAMSRDIEICVVDTGKLFGNGLCLPAGPLREPKSRLKQVDYIIYHKTLNLNKKMSYVESAEDTIYMQLDFEQVYPLDGFLLAEGSLPAECSKKSLNIAEFNNKTVHAVAGIASPERFFEQLRRCGLKVIEHPFADHHQFFQNDLEFGDQFPILMTEKDAVKCYAFRLSNCYYISVKAALSMDLVSSIIERLKIKGKLING